MRPPNDTEEPLTRLDDSELVSQINEGSEAAFAVLYHRYRDWVVSLAYRWTGDRDTALDVLQETFFYVSKKFPGFRLTARFQTFLYPVVRNLSIGARRKLLRMQTDDMEAQKLETHPAPVVKPSVDDDLRVILAGLSEEHRETLLLRFVDGLSLAEIALAMDVPLGTAKSRLHNALGVLRSDPRAQYFFEQ